MSEQALGWLFLAAVAVLLPVALPLGMATEILIYGIVAVAANLLIGYGGLYSFGQASFFGVGGYLAGNLLIHFHLSVLVPLLAATALSAVVAAAVGWVCVRRTGIYFIMLTFAFNQMFYYIAYQWQSVTGGEDGLIGISRPLLGFFGLGLSLDRPLAFYLFVAALFFVCFWLMQRLVDSPFGRLIVAIRENPQRAASVGYNTHRAQVLLFALSGAFTGLAGNLYAMLYGLMPIDSIHWLSSGFIIFMVLIGGTGNLFGPVVGVIIFIALQDELSVIWARWPLLFGALIVVVVMFFQGGVLQMLARGRSWLALRRRATHESAHG